jgi:hypothetical protein
MKGVPAMDIYSILSSKPHNPHYLNRYITFIRKCQQKNTGYDGYVEKHHICPKAKDMFPGYKSFKEHSWNLVKLTARQHFIAHLILWKTYPNFTSCLEAIWQMKHQNHEEINSRLYEKLKAAYIENKKQFVRVKDSNKNVKYIHKNDKKYKTGEYQFWALGMIPVKDAAGNSFMVYKDDERYLNGDLVHTSTGTMKNHIRITNGVKNKTISQDSEIPEGWRKGFITKSHRGYRKITNGKENRLIKPDEEIPIGWRRGITRNL